MYPEFCNLQSLQLDGFFSRSPAFKTKESKMLHCNTTAKFSENPMFGRKITRVLVIYTGGTIGMKKNSDNDYEVVPDYFADALMKLPMLYDEEYVRDGKRETANANESDQDLPYAKYPELVMPLSKQGVRVHYYIKEHNPIMDSCDMCMQHWSLIAQDIKQHYEYFDSFVVLHGTDTMAYTASALSYMLENLDKTVVITGSQIPIFEQRNDGRSNLIGALVIAGHFIIPEVTIFFGNKLLRGNRSQKVSASDLDAFASPNLPPLAKLGTDIEVAWDAVFPKTTMMPFTVHEKMCENVGLLRLFPGIKSEIIKAFLAPPMEGIVIESFGAGNLPGNRPDMLAEIRAAALRGVLIINITQCYKGSVTDAYAASAGLRAIGVIPGYDMTPEAALTKLAYVLSKEDLGHQQKKDLLWENIRGEVTHPNNNGKDYSMRDGEFVQSVARSLHVGSEKEMNSVRRALLPVLLTCSAKAGDVDTIRQLIQQGANLNEPSDYDGKTSLHLACAEGHVEVVQLLLKNGASAYVRDRRGRTPLFEAIRNKRYLVVKLLLSNGARFNYDDIEVARELCVAATENDVERLMLWKQGKVDLNMPDLDGRTPLHVAVLKRHIDVVRFLVESGVNVHKKDIFGHSPIESAVKLQYQDIVELLSRVPKGENKYFKINENDSTGKEAIAGTNQNNNDNNLINCKMNGEVNAL